MRSAAPKGFTLIEILLVIGLFSIIIELGLFMSMDMYKGYSRRSERDTLVDVLQRARSRAMSNVHQSPWGVCYDATNPSHPNYIIFSGVGYEGAVTKDIVPANPAVTTDLSAAASFACGSGGIVFSQLTGDTSALSVSMTQGSIISIISTNVEGAIIW